MAYRDWKKGEDLAVELLARGFSQTKAAKKVGVSNNTLSKYMREPTFRAKVDAFRNRLMSETVGRLNNMAKLAMDKLEGLLQDGDAKVRVAALKEWRACVTELGLQYDLQQRIEFKEQLEADAGQPHQTPSPD